MEESKRDFRFSFCLYGKMLVPAQKSRYNGDTNDLYGNVHCYLLLPFASLNEEI